MKRVRREVFGFLILFRYFLVMLPAWWKTWRVWGMPPENEWFVAMHYPREYRRGQELLERLDRA